MTLEVTSADGLAAFAYRYRRRIGIVAGIIIAVAFSVFMSNCLLKIEITGCSDSLSEDIMIFLENENITEGRFIPTLDYFSLEQKIKNTFEAVSFVNVRSFKSTLTVNVSEATDFPDLVSDNRQPSNIVSSKDAQIVRVEVYTGQLAVLVGSAVREGTLLVSGIVDNGRGEYMYYHALAKIFGEYTETIDFSQPFIDVEEKITENFDSKSFFGFFGVDIPLFWGDAPQGSYIKNEYKNSLHLFGIELPFSVNKVKYDYYEYTEHEYTYEEALQLAENKIKIYEENFLSDAEILDKQVVERSDESGVTLSVTYRVIDEIGVEKEIMLK